MDRRTTRRSQRSSVAVLILFLLVIVVGFGLLVGMCGIGFR